MLGRFFDRFESRTSRTIVELLCWALVGFVVTTGALMALGMVLAVLSFILP